MYIVKLDANGTLLWSKAFGGPGNDNGYSMIKTLDGGFAIAGASQSYYTGPYDMFLVKLNSSGLLQWSKTIGSNDSSDFAFSIVQTSDGGYALAGETRSFGAGNYDIYIVKLDNSAALQWSKTFGGPSYDNADAIIQTTDGGYAVAGTTGSFGSGGDIYLIKLDGFGSLQWNKTVGGSSYEVGYSIIQTIDGGYAVSGYTNSTPLMGMCIEKFTAGGMHQWSRTFGGPLEYPIKNSIIQTTDGGYALAGITQPGGLDDIYVVKLDGGGNSCGSIDTTTRAVTIPTPSITTQTPAIIASAPTVTSASPVVSSLGSPVMICSLVGINPVSNEIPDQYRLFQNYPNPFNPATKIKFQLPKSGFTKISVYDAVGQEITTLLNEQMNPGTYEVDWDASNYPSGVYFYRLAIPSDKLTSGGYEETKRMVLIK